MARYVLELRQRFWRSRVTVGMGILIVALGALAVLFPPRRWWGYLIGVAVIGFLVAMARLEVRRSWIAVDESSIHVSDATWGHRVMPRADVVSVGCVDGYWRIQGNDARVLTLRPLWSRKQLRLLADELKVPLQP